MNTTPTQNQPDPRASRAAKEIHAQNSQWLEDRCTLNVPTLTAIIQRVYGAGQTREADLLRLARLAYLYILDHAKWGMGIPANEESRLTRDEQKEFGRLAATYGQAIPSEPASPAPSDPQAITKARCAHKIALRKANTEVVAHLLAILKPHKCYETKPKTGIPHLVWMCEELLARGIADFPPDKSGRWIGFVQGCMASRGLLNVDAERDRTRPLFAKAYSEVEPATPSDPRPSADAEKIARELAEKLIVHTEIPRRIDQIAEAILPTIARLVEERDGAEATMMRINERWKETATGLTAARAEVEAITAKYRELEGACALGERNHRATIALLTTAQAERAELREDGARLDWLLANYAYAYETKEGTWNCEQVPDPFMEGGGRSAFYIDGHKTARAAIDSARRATNEGGSKT